MKTMLKKLVFVLIALCCLAGGIAWGYAAADSMPPSREPLSFTNTFQEAESVYFHRSFLLPPPVEYLITDSFVLGKLETDFITALENAVPMSSAKFPLQWDGNHISLGLVRFDGLKQYLDSVYHYAKSDDEAPSGFYVSLDTYTYYRFRDPATVDKLAAYWDALEYPQKESAQGEMPFRREVIYYE